MSQPIFVIGSANTDMVVKSKKLPAPGETVIGGTFLMNPGGKGANQAVAAARLGGRVNFVACLGNDVFGKESIQQLQRENVSTEFVHISHDHPSGVALINVNEHGENSIVVAPGANAQLTKEHVGNALKSITKPSIVLLQLEIPMNTVDFAIRESYENKNKVILNPAPANVIADDLFSMLFLITPNESEAELLTGVRVDDGITARQAAAVLHLKGVPQVIITMGPKGAFISTPQLQKLIPAPVVKAVDTTAAGDCFNGAIAVALAQGKELEEAVAWACHAASISVTHMGAQTSMPTEKEVSLSNSKSPVSK
jgi:ribokinase